MVDFASVLFCLLLLAGLVYFAYATLYEAGLAIYRRLPMQTQRQIDRLVVGGRNSA
jgi:hypothetical protein